MDTECHLTKEGDIVLLSEDMGSHLNLNLHLLAHQSHLGHRRRGLDLPQPFLQNRPALFEIVPIWQEIVHAHHVLHACACLLECSIDVDEGLVALLLHSWIEMRVCVIHSDRQCVGVSD